MKTSRQIIAIRVYVAVTALLVGGYGCCIFKAFMLEDKITILSIDTAVFACASCGYFLLRAVSRSRLNAIIAGVLFLVSAIGSAFVAPLLMLASRAFWPYFFRGEQALIFLAVPFVALGLSLGLLVVFLISLFFCRNPHAKPEA